MKIGLALSGGGTRAMVFHLGVLLRFAQQDFLENVVRISSVSGGSLIAALIFSRNKLAWPSSQQFRLEVYPSLRSLLTTTDLFSFSAVSRHVGQWPLVPFNRGRIVANLLEKRWKVFGKLQDLPDTPAWFINTTCIESGKNWRFSKFEMGDWKFGRHYSPPFSISETAAASSAVPYMIGALKFQLPADGWFETDPATSTSINQKSPPQNKIHLWDGGAYENLGIEPLYKPDRRMIECDEVIVSDASGLVHSVGEKINSPGLLTGNLDTPRLFDIASDQIRALRSRLFVEALTSGKANGALIRIGNSVRDIDIKSGRERIESEYQQFQPDEAVSQAHRHPTNLSAISAESFDIIVRHGFECTNATLTAYRPDLAKTNICWNSTIGH